MSIIRQLSENTINQIAAGEVVERPSSVVKELVENAIDAGATAIVVNIEQSGKNLISVSDNGCGMTKEDLLLAIQRHTTSKLKEDDIMNISSFGFRGEALPSIASVSRMNIASKVLEKDAHQIRIEGGRVLEIDVVARNDGTTIEVRDLFFATPARLKFLRSDRVEYSACLEVVKKIAMFHYNCAFEMIHNDKIILKLNRSNDISSRIIDILGDDFMRNSVILNAQRDDILIHGFTTIPTYNKATAEDQYLFINGRFVKDKLINTSLKLAYQDFLARDRFPVAVIFITTSPYFVDVNVHPAKTEVRFMDPQLMRGLLISTIKAALHSANHRVSDMNNIAMFEKIVPEVISHFAEIPKNYNHNMTTHNLYKNYNNMKNNPDAGLMPLVKNRNIESINLEQNNTIEFPLGAACAGIHKNYIISQTKDGIVIIDQHAAHERLGYEKLKKQFEEYGISKQLLLIPVLVKLDEKRCQLFDYHKEHIEKLGIRFDIVHDQQIVIYEIPQIIKEVNVEKLINDIADNLIELEMENAVSKIFEHILETYACHHAIRSGKVLSIPEMNYLLREMESTPYSGQCNHGRPTYVSLSLKDIEKLFQRN